jgi:predicted phage replisome organizer
VAEVKWIKLSTNMFDDEKIKLIEAMPDRDTILIIWVKLLAQAGKCNASGYLLLNQNIPYTDEMLSTIFNRPIGTVRMALEIFNRFGMIDIDDSTLHISNWEKHQNIEGMERIREQNRERKKRQREKQKLLPDKIVSRDSHVTSHQSHALDIDKDIEKEKEIKKNKKTYADVVLLTDEEYQKLVTEYGEKGANTRIQDLSFYIQSKGKKYNSHYATIQTWERKNNTATKAQKEECPYREVD